MEEDEDLLLRADGEGDSESEVEDNADQDSNGEFPPLSLSRFDSSVS